MKFTNKLTQCFLSGLVVAFGCSVATAQTSIRVTVTTTGPVGLAPALAAFHDGSYDVFDTGGTASAGLEALAEVGDLSTILGEAAAAGANAGAIVDGGPFVPGGGTASAVFSVDPTDTSFSFAAMVLPSNDWFIGNGSAVDISSLIGASVGTTLPAITLSTVYDAGTEEEDFAFGPGGGLVGITTTSSPGGGTSTSDPISAVSGPDPFAAFANVEPASFDTTTIDFTGGSVATVTLEVVPEPTAIALASLGVLGLCGMMRRRRTRRRMN